MKNFIFGTIFGAFLTSIVAWVYAERIVATKQEVKERARKNGKPSAGIYKRQSKVLIPPGEANFIPEAETFFQYPRKAELEEKPGQKNEEIYDACFREYKINRRLSKAEAWKQYKIDYAHLLPKSNPNEKKLDLSKYKNQFSSAWDRRENKLKGKTKKRKTKT